MAKKYESVDDYVADVPDGARATLDTVLAAIRDEAPGAAETISYQMPTFRQDGKVLVHVAAWKHHIGMYPIPEGTAEFRREAAAYAEAKGTLRFPLDQPVPVAFVRDVVRFRAAEIAER